MTLGNKLAKYRKLCGLTQQQLGERLNLSAQAISKWENDLAQPDLISLKAMSQLYRVSLDEMLDLGGDVKMDGALGEEGRSDSSRDEAEKEKAVASGGAEELLGFCKSCGIAVNSKNLGITAPQVKCDKCYAEEKRKLSELHKELESRKRFAEFEKRYRLEKTLKDAFIKSGILGATFLLLALILPIGGYRILMIFFAYSIFTLSFMGNFQNGAMQVALGVLISGEELKELGRDVIDDGYFIFGAPMVVAGVILKIIGFVVSIPLGLIVSAVVFPICVKGIVDAVKRADDTVLLEISKNPS